MARAARGVPPRYACGIRNPLAAPHAPVKREAPLNKRTLPIYVHRAVDRAGSSAVALPVLVGVCAFLVRLHGLGDKPFWLDEIASLRRATGGVDQLLLDTVHNHHSPGYFLLLWLVARFGSGEFLLRLPSAIAGAAAVALVANIGGRLGGWRIAVLAGGLLALSPLEVQLGQEARSYTLVCVLILIALRALLLLARDPDGAARATGRAKPICRAWLAYSLATAGALNVLGVAVLWWVSANVGVLGILCRGGAWRAAFLRRWSIANAFVLALWAPLLVAQLMLNGPVGAMPTSTWTPPLTANAVWDALAPVYLLRISDFLTFDLAPVVVPGLSLVVALLAALGAWRLRDEPAVLAVLVAAAAVPPLLLLLLSPAMSLLLPRYLAWSAAPFFLLAAFGVRAPSRGWPALLLVLATACWLNLAPYYASETKPRWDLAAKFLAEEARPGDVVLADRGYTYFVFSVFAKRVHLADRGISVSRDLAQAKARASGHDLWALFGRIGQQSIGSPEDYLRSLASLGPPREHHSIGKFITVYRFTPPAM